LPSPKPLLDGVVAVNLTVKNSPVATGSNNSSYQISKDAWNAANSTVQADATGIVVATGTGANTTWASHDTLPISLGGTNATTANDARNSLLPDQTSYTGRFLSTDGANVSWPSVLYTDGTNVGINTTSPTERLTVNGNASVATDLTVNGTLNSSSILFPSGTDLSILGVSRGGDGNVTIAGATSNYLKAGNVVVRGGYGSNTNAGELSLWGGNVTFGSGCGGNVTISGGTGLGDLPGGRVIINSTLSIAITNAPLLTTDSNGNITNGTLTASTATNLTGPIVGNGTNIGAVTPVADGTYTVGIGGTTNGVITVVNGIITAITQAS